MSSDPVAADAARVVLITGASSGLGRAVAHRCARRGDDLVLGGRGTEGLQAAASECRQLGARAAVVPTDVGDAVAVEQLFQAALEQFGRVDVVISAAAGLVVGRLEQQPVAEIEAIVRTNVVGSMLIARRALQLFGDQQHGTLVLVSSLLGVVPNPLVSSYTATKFAVRGLALSLRRSVAGLGDAHVSCVLPGPLDTPMFQHAANHTGHALRAIPPAMAVERQAARVEWATRRPRRVVLAGVAPRMLWLGHRVAPRLVDWGVATWAAGLIVRHDEVAPDGPGDLLRAAIGPGATGGGWRRGRARRMLAATLTGTRHDGTARNAAVGRSATDHVAHLADHRLGSGADGLHGA
jgi:short-subunit dehydrogenase